MAEEAQAASGASSSEREPGVSTRLHSIQRLVYMILVLAQNMDHYFEWARANRFSARSSHPVLIPSDLEGWAQDVELLVLNGGLLRRGMQGAVNRWLKRGRKMHYAKM